MSKFIQISALLLCSFFTLNLSAQSNPDEAAVLKMWDAVWQAYANNDEAKMWSYYADNACEVYPDGSSLCGKQAIKEGYEQFKTMLEGKPSWTYTKPTVQFISPDLVMLLSEVTSDMKLKGGQQIGGKTKFMALAHKVNGHWLIVFDSQTPILPPPAGN